MLKQDVIEGDTALDWTITIRYRMRRSAVRTYTGTIQETDKLLDRIMQDKRVKRVSAIARTTPLELAR